MTGAEAEQVEAEAPAVSDVGSWTVSGNSQSAEFGTMVANVTYCDGDTHIHVEAADADDTHRRRFTVIARVLQREVDVATARTWALEMARTWLREQLAALERVR